MKNDIKTLAFDADDTLWINEIYFQEAEQEFCSLLVNQLPAHLVSEELFTTEMKNLPLYSYGVRGCVLCMIETANRIAGPDVSSVLTDKMILPVLELGGFAAHIPYQFTGAHEQHNKELKHSNFVVLKQLNEILNYL